MKKINDILSHLKSNPTFRKKFNSSQLINEFIEILPLKLKKGIKFAYVKRQKLYFVLTHQVYKMDFEYNKEDIKASLRSSKIANIEDIVFFVTNKPPKKKIQKQKSEEKAKELSKGDFINHIKNPKLHKQMESIRKIIKKIN